MSGTQNAAGSVARPNTPASPKVEGNVLTDAQMASLRDEGRREGQKAGMTEGRASERVRMAAILDSEEAKGRDALARHFAFETDTSAEAAVAALAKSPKAEAKAEAKPNRFDEAMAAAGNPKVGLEPPAPANGDDGLAFADAYFASKRQKRSA